MIGLILNIQLVVLYMMGFMFDFDYSSPAASHMTSDEEQAFMLKDYAHQIIILIIALRQGRYFTT